MNSWAPIKYMGYWDVPLVFVFRHHGELFLFECEFDNEREDYAESYKVYTLPELDSDALPEDWTTLRFHATRYLGEVPVEKVRFDPTRRHEVETAVLDELLAGAKEN